MPSAPESGAASLSTVGVGSQSAPGRSHAKSGFMKEDTFRILYERTSRPLFLYLFRVSGQRELAQDLLQEAYCRLLSTQLPAMDESQMKSYLYKIATNLLRDHWRSEKSKALAEVAEAQPRAYGGETGLDLRSAFDRLKSRERQLLWLAYVEGSSHREIANTTGLGKGKHPAITVPRPEEAGKCAPQRRE